MVCDPGVGLVSLYPSPQYVVRGWALYSCIHHYGMWPRGGPCILVSVTTVYDLGGALVSLYPSPRYVARGWALYPCIRHHGMWPGGGPCILVSVITVCDPGVGLVSLYPSPWCVARGCGLGMHMALVPLYPCIHHHGTCAWPAAVARGWLLYPCIFNSLYACILVSITTVRVHGPRLWPGGGSCILVSLIPCMLVSLIPSPRYVHGPRL